MFQGNGAISMQRFLAVLHICELLDDCQGDLPLFPLLSPGGWNIGGKSDNVA